MSKELVNSAQESSYQEIEILDISTDTNTELAVRSTTEGQLVVQDYKKLAALTKQIDSTLETSSLVCIPETTTVNWFAKDIYSRWLKFPAGTLLTGQIHKFEHFFMLVSGTAVIYSTEISTIKITAPWMTISPKGSQRAILALTDVTIATFHPNVIEEEDMKVACTCNSEEDFIKYISE